MLHLLVLLAELVGVCIAVAFLFWFIVWVAIILLGIWAVLTPSQRQRRSDKLRKQRVKANKERLAARNRRDAIRKEQG